MKHSPHAFGKRRALRRHRIRTEEIAAGSNRERELNGHLRKSVAVSRKKAWFRDREREVTAMTQADVNRYKALLIAKREAIVSQSGRREGIWIVQSNEQIEAVQLAGQREIAALALERETESLIQVGAALERIDDGEFGICVDCEEPITAKRLAAVPWAAYCLNCQELHDAREPIGTFRPKLAA